MKNYVGLKASNMGFDAHLTIHYLGEISEDKMLEIKEFIEPYKDFNTRVLRDRISMFGYGKVPVVEVKIKKDLMDLKEKLEKIYETPSLYLPWKPHITLKMNHSNTISIPPTITLYRLGVY